MKEEQQRDRLDIPGNPDVVVLLHNIRSAHNVGSMFRTGDAAGVTQIILSGYTPRPIDKYGNVQTGIAKTALGSEKAIPWVSVDSPRASLAKLKLQGYQVIGLEQDARSCDYRSVHCPARCVFVVGNEVRGMSPALRAQCDTLIEIPMRGTKESLNVSVAFGIALYALRDK